MSANRNVRKLQRRRLLQLVPAAGLGAAFPWSRQAEAQGGIRRLLMFYTPHGTMVHDQRGPSMYPTGTEADFQLHNVFQSLEPYQDRMVFFDHTLGRAFQNGADNRNASAPGVVTGSHTVGMVFQWTGGGLVPGDIFRTHGASYGWNSHGSIDQIIGNRINSRPLTLGIDCGPDQRPGARMIYAGPGQPVNPIMGASNALQQVFGAAVERSPEANLQLERRRALVLGAIRTDLERVRSRFGVRAARRLDAHAARIRDLEALTASPPGETTCERPDVGPGSNLSQQIDQMGRVAAIALACGTHRIVSIQCRIGDNDNSTYSGMTGRHHSTSHEGGRTRELEPVRQFYAERFAELLRSLESHREGDGTLLDHTLVVWGSECGSHENQGPHSEHRYNAPFVIAGGGRQGVQQGRWRPNVNQDRNRMLVSMAHYMGVTDIEQVGDADPGQGTVSELLA